ncbi:MAG: hypothetical protein JW786_08055 [Desulfobacterales bacterium]|nr:hypothetical protein [Desulfobacterales bacterium]
MTLTTEEARTIADAFLEAAQAIDKYLDDNFNQISRAEYEFLSESFKTLMRVSIFTTTTAVGLAIDALEEPVIQLKNVIEQTKEKIEELQAVGRVIRFVAGLADLAAAITAKDPNAIAASVTHLDKLINESWIM